MGAKYGANFSATSTASSTVPMSVITSGGTKRIRVYGLIVGCVAAPANQANQFSHRRTSARGTSSATVTPNPLDGADGAFLGTFDTGWSVNPTITANSDLEQLSLNQQATAQMMLGPGYEMIIPFTSGAGLALVAVATTAAASCQFAQLFEE
jgi:hypothetical protein